MTKKRGEKPVHYQKEMEILVSDVTGAPNKFQSELSNGVYWSISQGREAKGRDLVWARNDGFSSLIFVTF
jgi:hypothetical protein